MFQAFVSVIIWKKAIGKAIGCLMFKNTVFAVSIIFTSFLRTALQLIFVKSTHIKTPPKILKRYPIIMIPMVTMPIKIPSSFGLTTFLSIIIDGRESAVTLIINARTVPIPTPLK